MQFKLLVISGNAGKAEAHLTTPAIIGRSRDAQIKLGHPLVSRKHCEITEGDEGLLVIEDLGSLNGTLVNNHRIAEPVYLEPGDSFTVGDVTFQAVYGNYNPATPAAVIIPLEDDVDFLPAEGNATVPVEPVDEAEEFDDFVEFADEETADPGQPAGDAPFASGGGEEEPASEGGGGGGLSWLNGPGGGSEGHAKPAEDEEDIDDFFKSF